jgi:hypothetical protein
MNTDANKTIFEGTLKPLQNATRLYEATVCPPSIAIFEVVDGSTAWRPKNYENTYPETVLLHRNIPGGGP